MKTATPSCPFLRGVFLTGLVLGFLLSGAGPVRAQAGLDKAMQKLAADVQEVLDRQQQKSVAIGQFTAPARLRASGGPLIADTLAAELRKLGVAIDHKSPLEVRGSYRHVQDKTAGKFFAEVKAEVLDRDGKVIRQLGADAASQGLRDATLDLLFGVTRDTADAANQPAPDLKRFEAKLTEKMIEAVVDPRFYPDQARVFADKNSPFGVEVLVKNGRDYQSRTPRDDDGQAFVPIQKTEIYTVRLINNANYEAAVTLSIDGLSMFAFSEVKNKETGRPKYTHIFVPAKSSTLIKGWHITNTDTNEFLVTDYAKSAAAALKSEAPVGMITACFGASWEEGKQPPPGEIDNARGDAATGHGARIREEFEVVKRSVGRIRSTVTVRYTR